MGESSESGWVAGADRVDAVQTVWDTFRRGSGVVVVDAPAGLGRTFLLELVYRRFAAGTTYWPPALPAGRLGFDQLDIPPNAALNRLWLAATADGTAGHPLEQLAAQIDAHARTIRRLVAAQKGLVPKVAYWAAQAFGLGLTISAGLPPVGHVPEAVGFLFQLAAGLDSTVRSANPLTESGTLASAQAINAGWTVYPNETGDLAASVAEVGEGLKLVSQAIPILLVIDDAEHLDFQTVQLLKTISQGDSRITVVIATSLTATTGHLHQWLTDPTTTTKRVRLAPLPALELADLAAGTVPVNPASKPLLAQLLMAAAGQPGILGDLLNLPQIRTHLVDGEPFTTDLASLTRRAGIDDTRHAQLPADARQTVEHLAVLGVITMTSWAIATGLTQPDLDTAAATGIIHIHGSRISFTSTRTHQAALRAHHHDTAATAAIIDRYRKAIQEAHLDQTWPYTAATVRAAALDTLTHHLPDVDAGWHAELLDLRRQAGQLTNPNDPLLQTIIDRAGTFTVGHSQLIRAAATTLATLGQHHKALTLYQTELDRVRTTHPNPHPSHIPALEGLARLNLAQAHNTEDPEHATPLLLAAANQLTQVLELREPQLRDLQHTNPHRYTELLERTTITRWTLAETLATLHHYDGPNAALHHATTTINHLHHLGRADHETTLDKRNIQAIWTYEAGHYQQALQLTTALLPDTQRVLGPEYPTTLTIRHNLAVCRGEAGDPAGAAAACKELLPVQERVLGAQHPDTLTTRNSLANWQGEAGDPAGAAAAFEELLPLRERVLGAEHPDTLTTRNSLALWRGEAGDPAGAAAAFEELLPLQERVLGAEHPDTLTTRSNLAGGRGLAGDSAGAAAGYAALLPLQERVLGPDHPETLSTRHNLAGWRGEAGDPKGAAAALEELLPLQERVLGPEHPDTLKTRHNLAASRGQAGDPKGAAAAYAELLPLQERVLGPEHPETLKTRQNLAGWRGEAGDPAGAAAAFAQLVPVLESVLGAEHPDTLTTRNSLALWRGEAGDPAGAAAAFEELLPLQERVLGAEHPDTLTTRSNLAGWRGEAGDPAGAEAAFAQLVPLQESVLGAEHPETLTTRANLARWRGEAGDPAGAEDAFAQLVPVLESVLGAEHPETLANRANLAYWSGASGDPAAAAAAFEELIPLCERVFGPEHPNTLTVRGSLARWRGEAGDPKGAAAAYAELLPLQERVLGPEHPDTLTTRHNYANSLGTTGNSAGATAAFEELLPIRERVLGPNHPDTVKTRQAHTKWARLMSSEPPDC